MSFKKSFCSSPWFHVWLKSDGGFVPCRWFDTAGPYYRSIVTDLDNSPTLNNSSIMKYYNSEEMKKLRLTLLDGNQPPECRSCYYEDEFNKVSSRQKQLLKSGIRLDDFTNTVKASPHYKLFDHSYNNNGESTHEPTDLQIELGSICNSSCIMCSPIYSTRLAEDFRKLEKTNPTQFQMPVLNPNWADDPEKVKLVSKEISSFNNVKYIHFLGGETLYADSFYQICDSLIDSGKAKNIIVGTTTNGTIYSDRLEQLIKEFKQFHLGISIESVNPLNDYIRWPGKVSEILTNIDRFLALRNDHPDLFISLRITPNIFTIYYLDELFEFMIDRGVTAESCNILWKPSVLRIELLPDDLRAQAINKIEQFINKYQLNETKKIINTRNPAFINDSIINAVYDYLKILKNMKTPDNAEEERFNLVTFIKSWESIRGNNILDYVPEYEQFLRLYGY